MAFRIQRRHTDFRAFVERLAEDLVPAFQRNRDPGLHERGGADPAVFEKPEPLPGSADVARPDFIPLEITFQQRQRHVVGAGVHVDAHDHVVKIGGNVAGRIPSDNDRLRGDRGTLRDHPCPFVAVLRAPNLAPLAGPVHGILAPLNTLVPAVGFHRPVIQNGLGGHLLVAVAARAGRHELDVHALVPEVPLLQSNVIRQRKYSVVDFDLQVLEGHGEVPVTIMNSRFSRLDQQVVQVNGENRQGRQSSGGGIPRDGTHMQSLPGQAGDEFTKSVAARETC